MRVTVAVSLGRHAKSGRAMLSPNDARALAVARSLCDQPRLVHVGEASQQMTLRQYLGLGFDQLDLVESDPGQDICGALVGYLRANPCDVIITGQQALGQEDTGMVPYVLAEALGRPLIDRVLSVAEGQVTQFLPKGRRRVMPLASPSIISVSDKAPLTLEYIARHARNGQIQVLSPTTEAVPNSYLAWERQPMQPGRKRLSVPSSSKGWARFNQRMSSGGGAGEVFQGPLDQGAGKVLDLLRDKKLI